MADNQLLRAEQKVLGLQVQLNADPGKGNDIKSLINTAALLHRVFLGIAFPTGVDGNLTLVNILQLEQYVSPDRYDFARFAWSDDRFEHCYIEVLELFQVVDILLDMQICALADSVQLQPLAYRTKWN